MSMRRDVKKCVDAIFGACLYDANDNAGVEQMTELRGYAKTISEATGVTDAEDLAEIEDVMRHEIFHSTLDKLAGAA